MIHFRCDADEAIGLGHLQRCMALARRLLKFGKVRFIVPERQARVHALLDAQGLEHVGLCAGEAHADEIDRYPPDVRRIVVDIGHRANVTCTRRYTEYLHALAKRSIGIVLVDGLCGEAYRDPDAPRVLACVQPYWSTQREKPPRCDVWLHGPPFTLLDEIYDDAFAPGASSAIENVLLTVGGGDRHGTTVDVLQGLADCGPLRVRVVVGPLFSGTLRERIQALADSSEGVELIDAPANLREHYAWADLCIGGSGMSKYEAAACGTPLLFCAVSPEHEAACEDFAAFGTAVYAGRREALRPDGWAKAIRALQDDSPQSLDAMKRAMRRVHRQGGGGQLLAERVAEIFEHA